MFILLCCTILTLPSSFSFFVFTFILLFSFLNGASIALLRISVVGVSFPHILFHSSLVPLSLLKSFCGQSLLYLIALWAIKILRFLGPGVLGTIVLSADGIPIRTTFDSATTVQVNPRSPVKRTPQAIYHSRLLFDSWLRNLAG
jgi:hypothetical protein